MSISPIKAEMDRYIATAKKRRQVEQEQKVQRQKQGLKIAQQAAKILRERFHVQKVWLFGDILIPYRV